MCAEPDFVGSALVRESSGSKDGDDDKIYFFFSERALELDCDTELTVARVARVCKVTQQIRIRTNLRADSISCLLLPQPHAPCALCTLEVNNWEKQRFVLTCERGDRFNCKSQSFVHTWQRISCFLFSPAVLAAVPESLIMRGSIC